MSIVKGRLKKRILPVAHLGLRFRIQGLGALGI